MENDDTINGSSEAAAGSEAAGIQKLTRHVDGGGGQEDANAGNGDEPEPSDRRKEILKALAAVERDSAAIAESFSSLFASLRLSLSQATSSTVEHMNCFSDAAGRLQECALDASTKGNRYINSCLRLNEEMKGMDALATQLYPFIVLISCAYASMCKNVAFTSF
ncbi:hypothetical protein Salat_0698600 [Sesamum alatum]|uniref:BLOC-1-related complex subunit 6 C-terminal helix domain-containing protein n=1 Tax=Sesamum alatum TaxID=300844 RepID=A0AAE1YSI3_9LAMI|nr:hypothetical protein Salat_0698600 [Sesamum alatum]